MPRLLDLITRRLKDDRNILDREVDTLLKVGEKRSVPLHMLINSLNLTKVNISATDRQ